MPLSLENWESGSRSYGTRLVKADYSKPNEIIPGLWVGNIHNCADFDGICINVTEGSPCESPHCIHIPVVDQGGPTFANRKQLDEVADLVKFTLEQHSVPVMLHCWVGMERSPLAATWAVKRIQKIKLGKAWRIVREKRKIAADRREWLKNKLPYSWSVNTFKDDDDDFAGRVKSWHKLPYASGGYYLDAEGHWQLIPSGAPAFEPAGKGMKLVGE